MITQNEDLKKLKEDFLIAIENTKKKISFYPINVFDKIENMFMVTLSDIETVFKINELLHGLWMESKNSRRTCKSLVDTKNDLKILKDKFCALTKKHEAVEMILNEQRIQLDDKEKELKNTFCSFNLQLENKLMK